VLLTRSATKMEAEYGYHMRVSARKIFVGGFHTFYRPRRALR